MGNGKAIEFIDLFAGIGGIRIGFERAGCKCVFSNDYDKSSSSTYTNNFGKDDFVFGDVKEISSESMPSFDILCAGFPCQPFSIAGVSKKNSLNRPHGFDDKAQGTLFYEIARIIDDKKPAAFFLENVKNIENHDKKRTFEIIRGTIEELGYSFYFQVINAKLILPQNRERMFMIGFRDRKIDFKFPLILNKNVKISQILEKHVPEKYTLSDHLWQYLQNYAEKHKSKGNGFGYGLVDLNGTSRTLSARYYKDGSEILIPQKNKNPRRLTPRECARLQGFPDDFKITAADTPAYKQFGNAVPPPVIELLAKQIVNSLKNKPQRETAYPVQQRLLI